MQYLMLLFVFR